jgi:protein-tyrosine phosphatase
MPTSVLFVCLGNICRSPAAEAAFRHLVNEAGLGDQFEIDSAGTGAWHAGQRADRRMRAAGRGRGIDVTSVARQIVADDFAHFDVILAMDRTNLRALRELSPAEHRPKVRLFRDLDPEGSGRDVPDPYYGDQEDFEHVLEIVERTGRAWLEQLRTTGRP